MYSYAALLAHGDGLRQRLPGCLWHGLDGKKLGWGSDGSGGAGREVHTCILCQKHIIIVFFFAYLHHSILLSVYVYVFVLCETPCTMFNVVCMCFYRESIYRLLPQTTPENIAKNFEQYTIDPGTRYPNLISSCVRPHQVRRGEGHSLSQYQILSVGH